jgi:hypothetical protein
VQVCFERKVLLTEKYCWLVADKPNEQVVDFLQNIFDDREHFTKQY